MGYVGDKKRDPDNFMALSRSMLTVFNNGTQQYCTPGHRSGKAMALMLAEMQTEASKFNQEMKVPSLGSTPFVDADIVRILSEIQKLDISISIDELGSIFRYGQDNPLGQDQKAIAALYGATHALPLTNGTTQGNAIALSAISRPGDLIILQRNSHVSAFAPIINVGLVPEYLTPEYVSEWDLTAGVTASQVSNVLDQHPNARVLFLTSPSYFGIVGELEAAVNIAKARGVYVVIDAAHGAYFRFHAQMPLAAEYTKADIVLQSTHKTLGALSQGSLMLINNPDLIEPVYDAVNKLGYFSTSFSFPILLSIDIAIAQMDIYGEALLERAIRVCETVRRRINQIEGLRCFGNELASQYDGVCAIDPLRITVNVEHLGVTGFDVEKRLKAEARIIPELATWKNLLFLFTPFDDEAHGNALVEGLERIAASITARRGLDVLEMPLPPERKCLPREAHFKPKREVPVAQASGLISGETIAAYPPGIAIVVEGEVITPEVVKYLSSVALKGGSLKGASDASFKTIRVLVDD